MYKEGVVECVLTHHGREFHATAMEGSLDDAHPPCISSTTKPRVNPQSSYNSLIPNGTVFGSRTDVRLDSEEVPYCPT